jgi:hypothetical protein
MHLFSPSSDLLGIIYVCAVGVTVSGLGNDTLLCYKLGRRSITAHSVFQACKHRFNKLSINKLRCADLIYASPYNDFVVELSTGYGK